MLITVYANDPPIHSIETNTNGSDAVPNTKPVKQRSKILKDIYYHINSQMTHNQRSILTQVKMS